VRDSAADLMTSLRQGRTVHLTTRPDDVTLWSLSDTDVTVRQVAPGDFEYRWDIVFNDGSCVAETKIETLDEVTVVERLNTIARSEVFPPWRRLNT